MADKKDARNGVKQSEANQNTEKDKVIDISSILSGKVHITLDEMKAGGWVYTKDTGKIDIDDYALCRELTRQFYFFVWGGVVWYYEHGVYHADTNETVIKTLIMMYLPQAFRRDPVISRIHRLFLLDARLQVSNEEEINRYPEHWVNTLSGMFDVQNWELLPHSPNYRSTIQIPHYFSGEKPPDGSGAAVWTFLKAAVTDPNDRKTVLEMIGNSCAADCTLQKSVILQGAGATGKSTLLNLVTAVIGRQNVSNVPLQKLERDFQAVPLIGKAVNIFSDIQSEAMPYTGRFKAIVCGEPINDSYKGKDNFSFTSFAKLWFSANELPRVSDRSDGFYRRICLIEMNNKPAKPDRQLGEKLTEPEEIYWLLYYSLLAYRAALKREAITESEQARQALRSYRWSNDTVQGWLDELYETTNNESDKVKRNQLCKTYEAYCRDLGTTPVNPRNLYEILRQKGYKEGKEHGGDRCFCGLKLHEQDPQQGFETCPEPAPFSG